MDPIARAYQQLQSGNRTAAVTALTGAGEGGNPDAWVELALWYLQGQWVERDLKLTRLCFSKAADLGHQRARMIHLSLLANGTGGPRNWPEALTRLRRLSNSNEEAARQVRLLDAMELNELGDPVGLPEGEIVSERPDVRIFRALLTSEECHFLASSAAPLFQPSVVIDPKTGVAIPHPVRTSENAAFPWLDENPVIHAINRRIAAASKTQAEWGEPLQILRYRPGQQYRAHHDAVSGTDNQRILTLLVYLNEAFEGGETYFFGNDLKVRGAVGDALLFRNAFDDGQPDPAAQHAGLPVTSGEKLIASRWIRQRRFGPAN